MSRTESHSVYWPRGPQTSTIHPLASRLDTLNGKTVAFLWDYVFRGDEIFPLVQRELSRRFDGVKFIPYAEFGSTHGDEEQAIVASLPERLQALNVDAVVSGMAC
ncbi:MAG TPA: hypothetical protein VNE58_03640 [Casimicrobiaceae bacterium]|nr:hypothetical protein [Casimicrobiaceae bacterium]